MQHLFLHVIPLPLPCDHPQKATQCFWAVGEKDIRRETQADVLRQLALCAQHYSAAALGLRPSRALDAERILTMAALATCFDAALRLRAADVRAGPIILYNPLYTL